MRKKLVLGILIIITGIAILTYYYLAKHDKNVKQWHAIPFPAKAASTILVIENLGNMLYTPPIDTIQPSVANRQMLMQSIHAGANWIVNMQEEQGRFQYWYDPGTNSYSDKHDDNFLRQAGTSYALMLSYEVTKDSTYLKAAKKSLNYLLQFKKELDEDKSYFLYNGKAKLGGIALPLLTMNKLYEVCKDTTYLEYMPKLLNMIIHLQSHYETGRFKSTYVYLGDYEHEKNSGWESNIYPGEALLALAFSYKNFGNELYKQSFDKAFSYYSKNGLWKDNDFTSWSISAFAEMYTITKEERYAEFMHKMCDYSIRWQNLNPNYVVYGSIYPLPTVFTATTFEGLGDAILAAKVQGNLKRHKLYKERTLIACNWLMKLQYSNTDKKIPEQAIGGFRKNLYDSKIRIDNTQHAISAMIKAIKNINFEN